MKIYIAGGSGFIGSALTRVLCDLGHTVTWISRDKTKYPDAPVSVINYDELTTFKVPEAVINLAGAGIADRPWTDSRRQTLIDSRIQPTEKLVKWLHDLSFSRHPKPIFLSGSAIGFYGTGGTGLTEEALGGTGFDATLCQRWEEVARRAKPVVSRLHLLRTGVVLGQGEGMLGRLELPFKLCLGGPIGSGSQIMSWISLSDWVRAAVFILENPCTSGPVNMTAPHSVSNRHFTEALSDALNRPAVIPMPAFPVRNLLGDMSKLLFEGQDVVPSVLLECGFKFKFERIEEALADIY